MRLDGRGISGGGRCGFGLEARSMPAAPLMLALFEPDIAVNAGAMMRTCACLGVDARSSSRRVLRSPIAGSAEPEWTTSTLCN